MTAEDLYRWTSALWVVWFVVLFTGIIIWAFLPKNRERLAQQALIPLREQE
ncbi:MAG: cbb3-type cytochrome c oxidase subunit 3 [Alphaproteobacteria bacterium]|nr:cbb3-type cytochrome c oxidase subunit 3 [Alphaproteobacteria bacterium]TAD86721.1 MAG: cbb3-type cytochrome c oxidase subunit 3 [Alphaproteobacteria bacterium]